VNFTNDPYDGSDCGTCEGTDEYDELKCRLSYANARKQWMDIEELEHIICALFHALHGISLTFSKFIILLSYCFVKYFVSQWDFMNDD
jgi:hypothetical protein